MTTVLVPVGLMLPSVLVSVPVLVAPTPIGRVVKVLKDVMVKRVVVSRDPTAACTVPSSADGRTGRVGCCGGAWRR